jgi:predicted RNA-binding protein
MSETYWISCGKPENWRIALRDQIWGLIPKFQGKWKYLEQGDWLFFYVTDPVKGVIGIGKVQAKFKQTRPLWPDEIAQNQVLYPFRFEFRPDYVLPEPEWVPKKFKVSLPIGSYSALNILDDQNIIDSLVGVAKSQWGVQFEEPRSASISLPEPGKADSAPSVELSHDKVKDMIFEIGKIHRYITDKEYVMNSDRLDVVWRRVEKSVPTYAFEIQIGGDIYHALAKLKHAHDLWNSNIYLVLDEKHREKAGELLSGTFHEITNVLKIINLEQVHELYLLQINDVKMRQQMGLP